MSNNTFYFEGIHVLGELYGINEELLNDFNLLEEAVSAGIIEANTTAHGTLVKKFFPTGITLITLLSESHVSLHTYPEYNCMFLDAFTCGQHCNPQKIIDRIIIATNPKKVILKNIERGNKEYINKEREI